MLYTFSRILLSLKKEGDSDTRSVTWVDLEDIMLSAISQSQKDKYSMILLIYGTYSSQIHRDRK